MKYKHLLFLLAFISAVFIFTPQKTYAAGWCAYGLPDPNTSCCTSLYGGGDCNNECTPAQKPCWRVNGVCQTNSAVNTALDGATTAKKEYNCDTGATKCTKDYCLNGTACQTIACTTPTCPLCDKDNRVTSSTCTGACGGCKTNYTDMDPDPLVYDCQYCDPSVSLFAGTTCMPMSTVASLLAPIFGTDVANLTAQSAAFITNMGLNKSYYFLAPNLNPLGPPPPPDVKYYQYGTGGGAVGAKVQLEADWADGSWLAEYLNWGNEPAASILNAIGALTCDNDSDCPSGVCLLPSGICQGSIPDTVSGATYVGPSTAAFAIGISGYSQANNACSGTLPGTTYSGSHVCTSAEILNSINKGTPSHLNLTVPAVWVSNGPPAYTANANDCRGWTKPADSTFYGTIWTRQTTDGFGLLSVCTASYKFACCK